MNEFLEQFLIEARELIEQGAADLLALEDHPEDRTRLDGVFRAFHTLKGSAGIVDFDAMGRGLHAAEDVLAQVRTGRRALTSDLVSDCLASLDQVTRWLDQIEQTGEIPADAEAAADAMAAQFATPEAERGGKGVAGPVSDVARALIAAQAAMVADAGEGIGLPGRIGAAGKAAANVLIAQRRTADADAVIAAARVAQDQRDAAPLMAALQATLGQGPAEAQGLDAAASTASRTLRIDVERVDALVRLTGELLVVKNALAHASALAQGGADQRVLAAHLKTQHAQMERLVAELQHSVLNIRVLPLKQVFQRFPRMVREIAATLGKPVRLVTEGEDTEADKAVVESLFEPLLHVLRNALDHGLEAPEARRAAGKPLVATLVLRAQKRGEHVVIELADDGAGVDVGKVRQIAALRGVATPAALADLTDSEVVDLIFEPGFSTANEVTSVSGRGVGMDAVRRGIEQLGGRVVMESVAGQGVTVRFNLPFTLIMTRVMTVEVAGQMFGVPLDAVVETVKVPRDMILPVGAASAVVLRERTLPLIALAEALGLKASTAPAEATLLVAEVLGQRIALEVDQLGQQMDVLLKPMEGLLVQARGMAGTTLLGDGRVLIVLDLGAFA